MYLIIKFEHKKVNTILKLQVMGNEIWIRLQMKPDSPDVRYKEPWEPCYNVRYRWDNFLKTRRMAVNTNRPKYGDNLGIIPEGVPDNCTKFEDEHVEVWTHDLPLLCRYFCPAVLPLTSDLLWSSGDLLLPVRGDDLWPAVVQVFSPVGWIFRGVLTGGGTHFFFTLTIQKQKKKKKILLCLHPLLYMHGHTHTCRVCNNAWPNRASTNKCCYDSTDLKKINK